MCPLRLICVTSIGGVTAAATCGAIDPNAAAAAAPHLTADTDFRSLDRGGEALPPLSPLLYSFDNEIHTEEEKKTKKNGKTRRSERASDRHRNLSFCRGSPSSSFLQIGVADAIF